MRKTRYLVIARMAGNFAMVGESTDATETIEQVIKRGAEHQLTADPSTKLLDPTMPVPVCPIHDRPMVLMQGRRGPFFSCHRKNDDGTWCDYQPADSAGP